MNCKTLFMVFYGRCLNGLSMWVLFLYYVKTNHFLLRFMDVELCFERVCNESSVNLIVYFYFQKPKVIITPPKSGGF